MKMVVMFTIHSLKDSEKKSLVEKKIWQEACPIPLERLRRCQLRYVDFSGVVHDDGAMIVLDRVAEAVITVFQALLEQKFPIHSIAPIEQFDGDDEASMAANNSSSFNFREIMGTDTLSMHSYGLAIDINPLQNPYITDGKIYPPQGEPYLSREILRPGMVEPIVPLLARHGFDVWGGHWTTPKDYHHFQIDRQKLEDFMTTHTKPNNG